MNCVCITAYKSPEMLSELLVTLEKDFYCFVHIDKNKEVLFEDVIKSHPNVSFYSTFAVKWGGYQHFEAIVMLLKETLKYKWDYVHIISGEDYPILSNKELILRFLDDNRTYIGYELATANNHSANRRYRYFWPYTKYGWNYKNRIVRFISLGIIALQYFFIRRKNIGEFQNIYWGFIWGDYHRTAIECIIKYMELHPKYLNDLKWCKIPEEFAFQTILLNDKSQANLVVNETLRFWNWSRGDNSGPPYLIMDDIDDLKKSNAIFARKVKHNSDVLNAIQEMRDMASL